AIGHKISYAQQLVRTRQINMGQKIHLLNVTHSFVPRVVLGLCAIVIFVFLLKLTRLILTLIKSISGIRGTIGGAPSENLTPLDAVKFAAAYGTWLKQQNTGKRLSVVIGRDARIS